MRQAGRSEPRAWVRLSPKGVCFTLSSAVCSLWYRAAGRFFGSEFGCGASGCTRSPGAASCVCSCAGEFWAAAGLGWANGGIICFSHNSTRNAGRCCLSLFRTLCVTMTKNGFSDCI